MDIKKGILYGFAVFGALFVFMILIIAITSSPAKESVAEPTPINAQIAAPM